MKPYFTNSLIPSFTKHLWNPTTSLALWSRLEKETSMFVLPLWGSQNFGKANITRQSEKPKLEMCIKALLVTWRWMKLFVVLGRKQGSHGSLRRGSSLWAGLEGGVKAVTGRNHMTSSGQWMEVTRFQAKKVKNQCASPISLFPFGSVCGAVSWNCRASRLNPTHVDLCTIDTPSAVISYWELGLPVATA